MTDDIVARLREFNEERLNYEPWTCEQTAKQAADEIERLAAELAAMTKDRDEQWRGHVAAIAKRDELRSELAAERKSKGTHHLWDRIRKHNAARESAEAERDALREQYEEAIAANMRRAYELAAERLKGQMRDRNDAERDALRALLELSRPYVGQADGLLADQIDAALKASQDDR